MRDAVASGRDPRPFALAHHTPRHKTRLRLRLPCLGPAYEEVFQDIFAIHGGERLLANLAMQRHIAEA